MNCLHLEAESLEFGGTELEIGNYPNSGITSLELAFDEWARGTGYKQTVVSWGEILEERFERLEQAIPQIIDRLETADSLSLGLVRLRSLVERGCQIFDLALDRLFGLIDGLDDDVDEIFELLQRGNDYICHTAQALNQLIDENECVLDSTTGLL